VYLLDTNACIAALTGRSASLVKRLSKVSAAEVALCSVVKAELYFGARKSARVEQNLSLLHEFTSPYKSFAFDDKAAQHYGAIRAELASSGRPIGPNDMMIAAIALSNDLVVITNNVGEFSRVSGLRIDNWQ
jgi:tRNA(fMet)-specific endonuclease VapC